MFANLDGEIDLIEIFDNVTMIGEPQVSTTIGILWVLTTFIIPWVLVIVPFSCNYITFIYTHFTYIYTHKI